MTDLIWSPGEYVCIVRRDSILSKETSTNSRSDRTDIRHSLLSYYCYAVLAACYSAVIVIQWSLKGYFRAVILFDVLVWLIFDFIYVDGNLHRGYRILISVLPQIHRCVVVLFYLSVSSRALWKTKHRHINRVGFEPKTFARSHFAS